MAGLRSVTRPLRAIPIDIVFVALALLSFQAALHFPAGHPLRVAVVLGVILTLPGYVLTTLVFPGYTSSPTSSSVVNNLGTGRLQFAALDDAERGGLSFALSLLLLPLFALILTYLEYPLRARYIFYAVTAFSVVVGFLGVVRRARLPAESRYDLPLDEWLGAAHAGFTSGGPLDVMLNVALAGAIILASVTLVGAVASPLDGYTSTDVSLVTINDDGEYVQQNYPTQFVKDQPRKITLVVANEENRPMKYTVVIQQQRVDEDGTVTDRQELDRFSRQVPDGGEWQVRHSFAPTVDGDRIRIAWLVYKGEVPQNPTSENADEHVTLWVEVVK
jgi:uncharacterized membrane protein